MHPTNYHTLFFARRAAALLLVAASGARAAPTLTTLHVFAGPPEDGQNPVGGLARTSKGVLIGTTLYGGAFGGPDDHGLSGSIFALMPPAAGQNAWTESVLASFNGNASGSQCLSPVLAANAIAGNRPYAPPTLDEADDIFVIAEGLDCFGTVAELTPTGKKAWSVSKAVTFTAPNNMPVYGNGAYDFGGPLVLSGGVVWGTTQGAGAQNNGEVFSTAIGGTPPITTQFSFPGGGNGGNPVTGLIMDSTGTFYGTTGGSGSLQDQKIYSLAPDGTYTVLYTFNGTDGQDPGPIVLRGTIIYGTTSNGGTLPGGGAGQGVVYSLKLDGTRSKYKVLHTFGQGTDGAHPSGIVFDGHGNIYGNATNGGSDGVSGILYELTPTTTGEWSETVLWYFNQNDANGAAPSGSLVMDKSGAIYGITQGGGGGLAPIGTVFQLVP